MVDLDVAQVVALGPVVVQEADLDSVQEAVLDAVQEADLDAVQEADLDVGQEADLDVVQEADLDAVQEAVLDLGVPRGVDLDPCAVRYPVDAAAFGQGEVGSISCRRKCTRTVN